MAISVELQVNLQKKSLAIDLVIYLLIKLTKGVFAIWATVPIRYTNRANTIKAFLQSRSGDNIT